MKPEEARDWQSPLVSLRERGSQLLKLGLWTDCVFLVGADQVRFAAHKIFLAICSPVFEAMFFGGMAEGTAPIPTPDVHPKAFKTLLKYVYTEKVKIKTFEHACNVFYTAKKYLMTSLISQCRGHLLSKLSASNVCHALELASMFDDKAIVDACNVVLTTQTSEVLSEKGFLEAHPSTLVKIFSLDKLNIKDELVLLLAVEKYANARGLGRSTDGQPKVKKPRIDEDQSSVMDTAAPDYTTDLEGLDEEDTKTLLLAVQQIRLLTVPGEELARHLPQSLVVPPSDALAILLHSVCATSTSPPRDYCLSKAIRLLNPPEPKIEPEPKVELTIRLRVLNFKTRKRRVQSRPLYVHGLPWILQVVPSDIEPRTLGLFVKCPITKYDNCTCVADVTFKLRGVHSVQHKIMKLTGIYTRDADVFGFRNFVPWSEACDPTMFLSTNSITVEARIAARIVEKPVKLPSTSPK